MASEELKNYIINSLKDGLSPTAIKNAVTKAGWTKEQVDNVFEEMEVKEIMGTEEEHQKETIVEAELKKEETPTFKESYSEDGLGGGEVDPGLRSYIVDNVKAGFGSLAIVTNLIDAGWHREDIDKVFCEKEVIDLLSKKKKFESVGGNTSEEVESRENPDLIKEVEDVINDTSKVPDEPVINTEDESIITKEKEYVEEVVPKDDSQLVSSEKKASEEKNKQEEVIEVKADTPPVKDSDLKDDKTETTPKEERGPVSPENLKENLEVKQEKNKQEEVIEVKADAPPVKDSDLKDDKTETTPKEEKEPVSPERKVKRSVSNPASFFIEDSMSGTDFNKQTGKEEDPDVK